MLICFSASWYWSIAKMLRTGHATGKSSGFVALIVIGYGFGVAAKLVGFHQTGVLSPLVWLYLWNLAVTAFDLWLVLRLCRAERERQAAAMVA